MTAAPSVDELCAWLRELGLDPETIPQQSSVDVQPGSVTVQCYHRDAAGKVDPRLGTSPRTVPLTVAPPWWGDGAYPSWLVTPAP